MTLKALLLVCGQYTRLKFSLTSDKKPTFWIYFSQFRMSSTSYELLHGKGRMDKKFSFFLIFPLEWKLFSDKVFSSYLYWFAKVFFLSWAFWSKRLNDFHPKWHLVKWPMCIRMLKDVIMRLFRNGENTRKQRSKDTNQSLISCSCQFLPQE